jgi:hypothetical protein
MSIKSAIAAMLLLSASALPALAENYANDPARPDQPIVTQRPLFGGGVAATQPTRKVVSNRANAPTQTDAIAGSSIPAVSSSAHMYDYLSGPEYRGGS